MPMTYGVVPQHAGAYPAAGNPINIVVGGVGGGAGNFGIEYDVERMTYMARHNPQYLVGRACAQAEAIITERLGAAIATKLISEFLNTGDAVIDSLTEVDEMNLAAQSADGQPRFVSAVCFKSAATVYAFEINRPEKFMR